jgi:Flp pilus assembly protein TadG
MKPAISYVCKKQARDAQRGAIAVEMAIILPLLALLLLGTLEFGSIARDHQLLQNAAREGARFSSLPANRKSGATNPAAVETVIKNRIIDYLQVDNITVPAGNIVVNQIFPVPIGSLTVQASKITVTYSRTLILPGITTLIPLGTLTLTGNAVFRNLY